MKRKVFIALLAILAVGLLFVGCSNGVPVSTPQPPLTDPENPVIDDEDDVIPEDQVETPVIDEAASQLDDAVYKVGNMAAALVVVPVSTPNSGNYTYEWWEADSADAGWTAVGVLESGDTFTPLTDAEGTFYYYCIVEFEGVTTLSRIVTITVEL